MLEDGSPKSNLKNKDVMNMNVVNREEIPKRKKGRPKKDDILKYRFMIRFNNRENEKFLTLFKQSGIKSKSQFIANCVLNRKLKVIEINKSAIDFVMLLTQFFTQFRGVKNNYNQLFTALVRNLGEEKARKFIKILENPTLEFIQTMKQIEQLIAKLREKCLPK